MRRFMHLVKTPARIARQEIRRRRSLAPQRLSGTLALHGGMPVRNVRLRPWARSPAATRSDWAKKLGPMMQRLFLTGEEGIPQKLAGEFAEKWAAHCGTRHALLLPHGTDALRIALAAALDHDGLDYGGEVIVPNLSFIASSTAALDRRLGVALVDVDPEALLIDPARVEEAVVPGRTRAIMAVHLFGQTADMAALRGIAQRHSLKIIEDAAQAHGAIHELGRAGALGDAAAFSFQAFKNLSSGEGGALTTSDPEIFERAYALHNVGRARIGGERWAHESLGWNCRATEYVAAVLLHRLESLEGEQETRAARLETLRRELAGIACVQPLGLGPGVRRHGVHMFAMRYRPEQCDGLSIHDFKEAVRAEGIPVSTIYNEATQAEQPVMRRLAERRPEYLRVLPTPVADRAVKELLWLPHNLFLGSDADMAEIAAAFAKVQAHYAPQARSSPPGERNGNGRVLAEHLPAGTEHASAHPRVAAAPVRPLRFGIIGVGVMGRLHAAAIRENRSLELAGVADLRPEAARQAADQFECRHFERAEDLIDGGHVDVIVIATPHWQHPELAVPALQVGLHVICEKPLAVTVAEADRLLEAAAASHGRFAVVYQNRFEPAYRYARELIEAGELGPIYRCSVVESAWRTDAYYRSSPWRGTWRGEGGGVLINQAPHVLDRYAWLFGMPESVTARCDTNLHKIEVEDTASAILRHANGAHGYVHVSTVEAPPISRTVVSGDRGRLTIENGRVFLSRLRGSIREKTETESGFGGNLAAESREIHVSQIASMPRLLAAFYENFAAAVAGQAELLCPGADGLNAVELANAIALSSQRGTTVTLPLDRDEYSQLIEGMLNAQPVSL